MDLIVYLGGGAAALLAIGTLAWRVLSWLRRIFGRIADFLEDWTGEPSRPGVPERPGVMRRLGRIEERLEAVEHEIHPNNGRSLKDTVTRTEVKVDDLRARLDQHLAEHATSEGRAR